MNLSEKFLALPQSARLDNGVETHFRRTLPSGLLSVQVWVKTGSIHEGEFLGGGLSHYLEHMVFKGTEKFSAEELTARVQAVGGNLNAYTTFTRTVYHADVPAEAAETAFETLAQLTLNPRLDALDAAREKDVILREIDMSLDDPDSRLSDATLAEAFRVHPFRVPVIGYKKVFSSMSDRELRAYFEKRYVPANIAIVVAGDADAGTIFALAEKHFGGATEKPAQQIFVPAEPPQLAPREITLRGDVNVLRGNMLWKIPHVAHEDAPALSVLSSLLGKGDSALLWRELHDEKGLAHALDVSAWMPRDGGLFWIGYTADLGRREAVESAIRESLAAIARDGVPPALLRKVSRQAVSALVDSLGTAASSAARLGAECVERGDPGATEIFLRKIETLTPEDLRCVARKYFREETQTSSAFEKTLPRRKNSAATKNASPKREAFPPFEELRLSSGVRVLLQPEPSLPKVRLRATMLGGNAFEADATRGASALLSTMLTLDAGALTAAQIAEKIESLGGSFDEVSGDNTLALAAGTLAGDEGIACEILSEALRDPRFSEKNFSRERASQLAALRSEFDEIEEFARIALRREFFGGHPLAFHNFGTEESLEALSLADVKRLRERLVVPENIVVSASGAFDRDALAATLEENFSAERFRAHSSEDFSRSFEKCAPRPSREIEIAAPVPAEQAIVQLAFPDTGFRDERRHVGMLIEELLSGMSSRLFLEVREKRGLAYFVGANRVGSPETGMFLLCAGTEKGKEKIVLGEMRKEMRRLREGKILESELLGAKTRICVARRTANQRAAVRCANAALNALYGLPVNRDAELEARLGALTADDVARYACEVLSPDFELALIVR